MNMKASKTLLVALIGGLVSTASYAQVELDITGGQTFKSAVINRLYSIFDGGAANTSSNVVDTNHLSFEGTASGVLGGNTTNVIVRLGFTSSEQGLLDLLEANLDGFPKTVNEGGGSVLISNVPNASFSDIFPGTAVPAQNASLFNDTAMGIVPFVFIGHNDLVFSNLTKETTISFYEFSGEITESFFSTNGSPSKTIYYIGRTSTSGARIIPEKVASYIGSPQIYGNVGGSLQPTSGLTSASSVVTTVSTFPGTIGSCGIADALTLPPGSGFVLTYEGYAPTPTNVVLGLYPIWSYDHAYTVKSTTNVNSLTTLQSTLFNALLSAITNNTFQTTNPAYTNSFVAFSAMQVNRQGDGTVIIPGQ
jgi:hypothetical protein